MWYTVGGGYRTRCFYIGSTPIFTAYLLKITAKFWVLYTVPKSQQNFGCYIQYQNHSKILVLYTVSNVHTTIPSYPVHHSHQNFTLALAYLNCYNCTNLPTIPYMTNLPTTTPAESIAIAPEQLEVLQLAACNCSFRAPRL